MKLIKKKINSHFNYLFAIFLCLFFTSLSHAQNRTEKITVPWTESLKKTQNEITYYLPRIENQEYNGYKPHYSQIMKCARNEKVSAQIKSKKTAAATDQDLAYLNAFQIQVPSTVEMECATSNARNQKFTSFSFFPFVSENNTVYRITELEVDFISHPVATAFHSKSFANESVLNDPNSSWYKISVKADGIYKIDKNWFDIHGIPLSGISPDDIHLYGNGDGKLSELNSDPRTDDLAENEMLFVGNGDLVFDADEYFLFYGKGPNKWNFSGGEFRRDLNIYSDDSFYFIRFNSSQTPKRISGVASTLTAETMQVLDFNHYDIYELDSKNLVGGGQRWYGELFDTELAYTFNFSIPNIVTSDSIRFYSSFAANATSSGNTYTFSTGGTTLYTGNLFSSSSDFRRIEVSYKYNSLSSLVPVSLTVNRTNPSVLTYLDKIELNARRFLVFNGSQFQFRDAKSVGAGNIARFVVSNVQSNYFYWDITDHTSPKLIDGDYLNNTFSFNVQTDSLREFIASSGSGFLTPVYVKPVVPQNLHGLGFAKLLIVTHPDFISQAERLAAIHIAEGTSTHVVTSEQVYNEFSSGMSDPTAIKWFAKMFYDRAAGDPAKMPENLLLFGDGTYDPKNRVSGNNYFIPTYQVLSSEDHINAMVTDDYFGMLDDDEAIFDKDMMDIGVGRMIVSNLEQSAQMVDKVVQYLREGLQNPATSACVTDGTATCTSFGDWRQKYVQIADDEEGGYFVNVDTEPQYQHVSANFPDMNADKIYLDAYTQVSTAGGERYPDVYDAITDRVQRGSLIINYVGHGGEVGVAEERVITIPQIQSWANLCNLNLFVSATCEFTKFDDPARVSAGEWVYLNPYGGAIALMTTTRSVYFGVNSLIGKKFYENVFLRDAAFQPLTFGEIMRNTKNQAGTNSNKRSFNLIGDPALRIALPQLRIVTDSINSFSPLTYNDTLEALSRARIKGHIEDYNGNILNGFNGILTPSIFDKKKIAQTLGQNDDSPIIQFETQKNILYKGKASITNGYFDFTFIVPKDINYAYGNGKISLYGNSETQDAGGSETRFYIGGVSPAGLNDNAGPEIKMYFNTETFINGGFTDENPVLIAKIFDENGVNTVGNGIGHDITAIIDEKTADPIVLNDYYNADLDTYQSGQIRYNLLDLEPGRHTLSLKVWDVNNNSSETSIDFEVQKKENFELRHVLNYPNPFTTNTNFYFEHNQLCSALEVQIQIFTVSGKLVKTINQPVYNECYRSDQIKWDGRDDFGDQLARGVYIYNLTVTNPDNEKASKIEKLVILK